MEIRPELNNYVEQALKNIYTWPKENIDFKIGYIQGFADSVFQENLINYEEWHYVIREAVAKL